MCMDFKHPLLPLQPFLHWPIYGFRKIQDPRTTRRHVIQVDTFYSKLFLLSMIFFIYFQHLFGPTTSKSSRLKRGCRKPIEREFFLLRR